MLDRQIAEERERYQPSAAEKVFATVKSLLMRGLIIYFVMTMFRRPQQTPTTAGKGNEPAPQLPKGAASNLFINGTIFDLYVYLSEDENVIDFNDSTSLVWKHEGDSAKINFTKFSPKISRIFCYNFLGLVYGDWTSGPNGDGTYSFSIQFEPSPALQNNGSIYLHTFVVKEGKSPDPSAGKGKFSKKWTMYKKRMMNK